jgi:hypothetical protein
MEYYNKYIKYKKKYYNLKYGGSKKKDLKFKFKKQLQKCSTYLNFDCDNYGLGKKFSDTNIFILEISYDELTEKIIFKSAIDNIEYNTNIYVPIYINKKFIEHYLLDNKKIKLEDTKQKIYRPPRIRIKDYIIEYYNIPDRNIMIPIKFKEIGISGIQKSYVHNKPGYKYVFLSKNIIEKYFKDNNDFLKSKETKTDIINDIFYMTDGRQYIYSKKLEEENKKEDIKKIFSSLVTNNEISKQLLNSIIYLDDGINYDDRYKQYLINYNAPDNLKNKFSKVFRERGEYFKKIKERKYKLSKKIKPILKKIGFTDIDKIEELINNKLHNLIYNYDYKDNISSLFNINYNQCNGNVPLSDLELENKDTIINLFDKINKLESEQYKSVNDKFKILLDESKYTYDGDKGIPIYFELFGEEYKKTLNELKKIKNKDLRTLILKQKNLLYSLFNHNIIFFGLLDMLIPIINLIIIRKLYYLLYSIEWENYIPLLWWDVVINKYIFACRLNNMKRFFFIFKKEQKLSVKPENRVFEYTKQKYIFLNKIKYNKKNVWVFLKKDTKELIFVDRTSSIVYLNNSSIPTNVLYTELKMLLWRKDFTNEDFKFFHILDDNKHHDTVFCINTKTLNEEYIYENAEPKPILDKSVDVKSESKHKIIINKDNFIINGIKVREVKLSMDTDGRTIGFFNL